MKTTQQNEQANFFINYPPKPNPLLRHEKTINHPPKPNPLLRHEKTINHPPKPNPLLRLEAAVNGSHAHTRKLRFLRVFACSQFLIILREHFYT